MLELSGGEYRIQEKIGVGTIAEVYRVQSSADKKLYVVKILQRRWEQEDVYRKLFEKEIQVGKEVADSAARKWTLPIVKDGIEQGLPYFITPYMPYNLRQVLDQPSLLRRLLGSEKKPLELWLDLLRQLAQAIDAFHKAGYVHGDLKPSNIVLTENLEIKIIDFGTAQLSQLDYRSLHRDITRNLQEPAIAGSLAYMAPEQFGKLKPTRATDLYALGTIAWEMFYGQLPYRLYQDDTMFTYSRRKETEPPWKPHRSAVPKSILRVLLRSLQIDPRLRFKSAQEFMSALEWALRNPDDVQVYDPPLVWSYIVVGWTCLGVTFFLIAQRLWFLLGW